MFSDELFNSLMAMASSRGDLTDDEQSKYGTIFV